MVAVSLCDLVMQEDADMKTECGNLFQEDLIINDKTPAVRHHQRQTWSLS